jgi:hypothetical protein
MKKEKATWPIWVKILLVILFLVIGFILGAYSGTLFEKTSNQIIRVDFYEGTFSDNLGNTLGKCVAEFKLTTFATEARATTYYYNSSGNYIGYCPGGSGCYSSGQPIKASICTSPLLEDSCDNNPYGTKIKYRCTLNK